MEGGIRGRGGLDVNSLAFVSVVILWKFSLKRAQRPSVDMALRVQWTAESICQVEERATPASSFRIFVQPSSTDHSGSSFPLYLHLIWTKSLNPCHENEDGRQLTVCQKNYHRNPQSRRQYTVLQNAKQPS